MIMTFCFGHYNTVLSIRTGLTGKIALQAAFFREISRLTRQEFRKTSKSEQYSKFFVTEHRLRIGNLYILVWHGICKK